MSTRGRPSRLVIYERLDMQIAEGPCLGADQDAVRWAGSSVRAGD